MRCYAWDQEFSTKETDEFLTELAFWHISQIGNQGERERITTCINSGGIYSLCDYSASLETGPLNFYHASQAAAFFRKRDDIDLGIDKEQKAYEKFCSAEEACLTTNTAFRAWEQGRFQFDPATEAALSAAQRKISRVLGRVPFRREMQLRFGPGATTQIPKKAACASKKFSQPAACSGELSSLAKYVLEAVPAYTFEPDRVVVIPDVNADHELWEEYMLESLSLRESGFIPTAWSEKYVTYVKAGDDRKIMHVLVHPGRLSFVPKSYKTKRAIVVEPWLNGICQLAVGDIIADKLRKVGQDIRDQVRNQTLARRGSIDGSLATIDLSSASDTVATKLVEHLLPPDWFYLLSVLRTGRVEFDGRRIELQKFSSMGNGFTFPLETLIFWAVTSAVVGDEKSVSVYGDDIICPASDALEVMRVLGCLGFQANPDKSFWTGPFRESCGKDYYSGIDVRPIFIDGRLTGHDLFRLHNFYVRNGEPEAASIVLKAIDPSIRIYGPDGYGDGHLLGDWMPARSPEHLDRGWGGVCFDTFTYKKRTFKGRLPGDRVLPSYSIYVRGDGGPQQHLLGDEPFLDRDGAVTFPSWGSYRVGKRGEVVSNLPGKGSAKRISIYTLIPR